MPVARQEPSRFPPLDDCVIYESNLRAEGPRVGFTALAKRLDSIKALGVNVIWLMPVQPVGKVKSAGGLGSPYACADFSGVNPEFGTPDDLHSLINMAHRRKMAVLIDWVANHSAWDNPWVAQHKDWYLQDSKGTILSPPGTNWKDVAQVDYKNPALRTAMIAAMQGWIDKYDIDGFRCDAVDYVPIDFWMEAVPSLRKASKRPLLMLAEGWKPEFWAAGFDMTYGWHFCDKVLQIFNGHPASELATAIGEEAQGMPQGKRRLRFLTNHDKDAWDGAPRELYKTIHAIEVGFALEAFDGGVPLIYTGQEVDWPQRIPIFTQTTIDWEDTSGMRQWIPTVLALRHAHKVLRAGDAKDYSSENAVIIHRRLGSEEALVLANMRGFPVAVKLPENLTGIWIDGFSGRQAQAGNSLNLPPYAVAVLLREPSAGAAQR